jgi:gliding motility-associated-like protein
MDGEKTGKLTVTNGVCTSSEEITIKTRQCNDSKNINNNITACPGEKVTLTLDTDITGATNYKWSHDASITATSSIEVIISENIPSYICTFSKVENGIAIDYTETFAITLSTNCVTTLEEDHYLEACPEQEVTLTCNHSGSSITWLHNNSITTTTIKVNTNPIEEEIDEYTCIISNTINGQTTTYKETFHVKTSICKDKNSEESNVLLGSNITLSSQYSQTVGATYEWYKIEEDGSKTLVSTDASITFPASEAVTYECITKLPDGYTITETRKVEIYTLPVITPMKFFSPNGDDVNDLWLIDGIESAPNAYIRIYDRYSKLLYQCKGSEFGGWDGKYEGKDMVQDDYWYVISVPETEEQISGHFTLKR